MRLEGEEAALETLFLPLESARLEWPEPPAQALFLRARASAALRVAGPLRVVCEQSYRPYAAALEAEGFAVTPHPEVRDEGRFALVLVLPPRQREEARALLARAVQQARPGGVVIAAMTNKEGARSGEADLTRLLGPLERLSKHKCRVFWGAVGEAARGSALVSEWARLDAPRPIGDGRFLSRPGLFAWDRIDAASALLAAHLPTGLSGRAADLGAGFGYLAAELLSRNPAITALDLYEAEARALELARLNLAGEAGRVALGFHWHDVLEGLPRRYDLLVCNPPVHRGRATRVALGTGFIEAAARALRAGGRLYLVANRRLPYEATLGARFASVRVLAEAEGFKVIEAVMAGG